MALTKTNNIINLTPLNPVPLGKNMVPTAQDYSNNMLQVQNIFNSILNNNKASTIRILNFPFAAQVGARALGGI